MALFGKIRRKTEKKEELRAALTPREQLVLDPPEGEFAQALEAAASGDAEPVGRYLAGLRERAEWDQRSRAVDRITTGAVESPRWVRTWAESAPEDPDAQLVLASLLLRLAWEVRTSFQSHQVERWRFEKFHEQLEEATPHIRRAMELSPQEPEPWRLAMMQATGLEEEQQVVREYLDGARARDPFHYASVEQAVNGLGRKWGGSHDAAFSLAEEVADAAPADRMVQILPLRAAFEMWIDEAEARARYLPRVDAAIDRAAAYADQFPPGSPRAAEARSLLAFMYAMRERWQESYDAFHATRENVSWMPWEYETVEGVDNPDRFATMRDAVVIKLAHASG